MTRLGYTLSSEEFDAPTLVLRIASAGYDHVYVHQIGPDQGGFFDFYEREVLPEFA